MILSSQPEIFVVTKNRSHHFNSHGQPLAMGSCNYRMEKMLQTLNPVITVYFLVNHRYLLLFFIFRRKGANNVFSGRLREIHLFKTDNTRKSFIFVHVSSHCFQCIKFCLFVFCFCFFHFVKLLNVCSTKNPKQKSK